MVMPHALTGVEAEIVVLIAKDFPIGSHKVEPAYSVVISTREFRFIRAFCLFARAKARRYLRRLSPIDYYKTIESRANSHVACPLLVSAGRVNCSGSRKSELMLIQGRRADRWAGEPRRPLSSALSLDESQPLDPVAARGIYSCTHLPEDQSSALPERQSPVACFPRQPPVDPGLLICYQESAQRRARFFSCPDVSG